MGYIFSIIAFLILLPIILKLPLGLKTSTKIILLSVAFFVSILGTFAVPILGLLKSSLVLILLSVLLVYLLEKKLAEEFSDHAIETDIEGVPSIQKPKMIIVQEQKIEETGTDNIENDVIIQSSNEEGEDQGNDNDDEDFLEKRTALLELESTNDEAAPTLEDNIDVKADWLNEVLESVGDQEELGQIDHKESPKNLARSDDVLELVQEDQNNWLNDVSEMQELAEVDSKPSTFINSDELAELEELTILDKVKDNQEKITKVKNERLIDLDELETLDEIIFETTEAETKKK